MNSLKLIRHILPAALLFCTLAISSPIQAEEAPLSPAAQENQRKVDATTAAGIVFKLHYQFACHGVWNFANSGNITEETPQLFAASMETLAKDLGSFSESEYGQELKQESAKLIEYYTKAVTLTLKEEDREAAKKFFQEQGLDADDSELLITVINEMQNRLEKLAKLAEVPEWIYTTEADELGQKLEAK